MLAVPVNFSGDGRFFFFSQFRDFDSERSFYSPGFVINYHPSR